MTFEIVCSVKHEWKAELNGEMCHYRAICPLDLGLQNKEN